MFVTQLTFHSFGVYERGLDEKTGKADAWSVRPCKGGIAAKSMHVRMQCGLHASAWRADRAGIEYGEV
jgi:hypothetical protein